MSSAEAQVVFNQSSIQPREPAQDCFAQQFDLANPEKAMSSYQKVMHQHTKQQFDMVTTASSRRRSASPSGRRPHVPSLLSTSSKSTDRSRGSVSSNMSS